MALTQSRHLRATKVGVTPMSICTEALKQSAGSVQVPTRTQQQASTDAIRLRALAQRIEPDADRVAHWWAEDGIAEFDGLTAAELVAGGASAPLEVFLQHVIHGRRG